MNLDRFLRDAASAFGLPPTLAQRLVRTRPAPRLLDCAVSPRGRVLTCGADGRRVRV